MAVFVFLGGKPAAFARIKGRARAPLSDAAAVNATRCALQELLADTGLPVEASFGGRTKYNRARLGIAKTRARGAACVGEVATLVGGGSDARNRWLRLAARASSPP